MVRTITATQAVCDSCNYSWTVEDELPLRCPSCRTRAWNRPKQQARSHVSEIAFPAPRSQGRPKAQSGSICLDDAE